MPRKFAGYFLLSFLSFCFFTFVFHAIANAQTAPQEQAENTTPIVPTPTIFQGQLQVPYQASLSIAPLSSPTPTLTRQKILTATTHSSIANQTPTITATPTPTAIPIPTAIPTPQPTTPGPTDLESLFSKYSSLYSVSKDLLKKIANCESGFNSASDTGIYAGMFQFSATTWASVRGIMGLDTNPDLRRNSEEAIKTAAFMIARGEQNAWPNCH